MKSRTRRIAPFVAQLPQRIRITLPFHPLYCLEYGRVGYRRSWGNECVDLHDEQEQLITIPLTWIDATEPDPFVVIAAGRSYFRIEFLVRIVHLIERLKI
jgi:hypothetical protein